jgi:hypothetical protein
MNEIEKIIINVDIKEPVSISKLNPDKVFIYVSSAIVLLNALNLVLFYTL